MKKEKAIKQLLTLKKLTKGKELRLASTWKEKWKILISTILSAQTKDETTIKISIILYKKYPTLTKLANASIKHIEGIIKPINYYKTKTKHIKNTAKIIFKKGIPKDLESLLKLPGVGRKVGNVYLAEANKADTIGVDTHLKRISQKLNWTQNKNPYKIEKDLEKLFPKRYWNKLNSIVVMFGRVYGKNRKNENKILKNITNIK